MRDYLKTGQKLNSGKEEYEILGVSGEGSNCVAYYAEADNDTQYIIKEFYPDYLGLKRGLNGELTCPTRMKDRFENQKKAFIEATSVQIQLKNNYATSASISFVLSIFSLNNTLYTVAERVRGVIYSENYEMSLYDRVRLCKAVASYVGECHKMGFLCLDIKPDNIWVLPVTVELPMFFDFDSMIKVNDVKGNSISIYSENWAAPEQIVPTMHESIAYETDIFALGELLFWSVFERHSIENEHRNYSCYDFSQSRYYESLNAEAQEVLTDIFHNTLRSSLRNRYHDVSTLLEQIDFLLGFIYPGKEKILDVLPGYNNGFVGRKVFFAEIKCSFGKNQKVFLIGPGGIGKSEIAKEYVHRNQGLYSNVIFMTYSYSFVYTIANTDFINVINRQHDESDYEYCKRKINKLTEVAAKKKRKVLIVIDGLDAPIASENDREIWDKLDSINANVLVTSRHQQDQDLFGVLKVSGMNEEEIKELFYCNSGSDASNNDISGIIDYVQGLPLETVLIARRLREYELDPQMLLSKLNSGGLPSIDDGTVPWNQKYESVLSHLRSIFRLDNLDERQKTIMYEMALMPASGVEESIFEDIFEVEQHEIVDLIRTNSISKDNNRIINMHSAVKEMIILDEKNSEITNAVFTTAINSLERHRADGFHDNKELIKVYLSIAMIAKEKRVPGISVADYILIREDQTYIYYDSDDAIDLIKYAIEIYEDYFGNAYTESLTHAYCVYAANLRMAERPEYHTIAKKCRDLYKQAKAHNDLMGQAECLFQMAKDSENPHQIRDILKLTPLNLRITSEVFKTEHGAFSERKMKELHYLYPSLKDVYLSSRGISEAIIGYSDPGITEDVFYMRKNKNVVKKYKITMWSRKILENHENLKTENAINLLCDEVDMLILDYKYEEADKKLSTAINYFDENSIVETSKMKPIFSRHAMLAYVRGQYKEAENRFVRLRNLIHKTNCGGEIIADLYLSRVYTLNGNYEASDDLDYELFERIGKIEGYKQYNTYKAELYYNIATGFMQRGTYAKAYKYYFEAARSFLTSKVNYNKEKICSSLCEQRIAECGRLLGYDNEKNRQYMESARNAFRALLGEYHPYYLDCKEKMELFIGET